VAGGGRFRVEETCSRVRLLKQSLVDCERLLPPRVAALHCSGMVIVCGGRNDVRRSGFNLFGVQGTTGTNDKRIFYHVTDPFLTPGALDD
jgi:hypothetical protein